MSAAMTPEAKASILIEALPYITRFRDKIVVVKYGGNVLAGADEASALKVFAEDIVLMRQVAEHSK
jgi:acetylglutamate kinase